MNLRFVRFFLDCIAFGILEQVLKIKIWNEVLVRLSIY